MSISPIFIPDEGPEDSKIVFVGEAPGADEDEQGHPFVGEAGNLLTTCLGRNGVKREDVRLANLAHFRPPGNNFGSLLGTPQLASGIDQLYTYLRNHNPNVVCAMGGWPLYFLTGKKGKSAGEGITNWRGSILSCHVKGLEGLKVIPTFHPAYVTRDRSVYPTFDIDIQRAISDSSFPELNLPKRKFIIEPKGMELEEIVLCYEQAEQLAVDIETFGPRLACVGFAPSADEATCIVWSDSDSQIQNAIDRLLRSRARKIFHFGVFDTEYLFTKGFSTVNYTGDTMVNQHVLWAELPRSLAYLTSIYTREPYYKSERKDGGGDVKSWGAKVDRTRLWTYNCRDCTCTFEIFQKQVIEINEGPKEWRRFIDFEMEQQVVASAISRTGMLIDEERRKLLEGAVASEWQGYQYDLDTISGISVNANSHTQVRALLYDELGLPVKRHKDGKVTADDDALVTLLTFCKSKVDNLVRNSSKREWQKKFMIVKLIRLIRGVRKLLSSYIMVKKGADGRIRSTFKVPATETGRWSAEKYVDGTGCNLQTMPREGVDVKATESSLDNANDEVRAGLLQGVDEGGPDDTDDTDSP